MKIKKIFFTGILLLLINTKHYIFSQRIGIVDMGAVLAKMTEYKSINLQIENFARNWELEIFENEQKLKIIKEEYKKEEYLYTAYIKEKKQNEIKKLEQEVFGLSKKYFGYEGEIFKKPQELIKPLQDKIYAIIQRVSKERLLDLVLDRSAGSFVLYVDSKIDITYRVSQLLGL